jgi:hypothetical protein
LRLFLANEENIPTSTFIKKAGQNMIQRILILKSLKNVFLFLPEITFGNYEYHKDCQKNIYFCAIGSICETAYNLKNK